MGLLGRVRGLGTPAEDRMGALLTRAGTPQSLVVDIRAHETFVTTVIDGRPYSQEWTERLAQREAIQTAVKDADDGRRRALVGYALAALRCRQHGKGHFWESAEVVALAAVGRRKLPWSAAEVTWLLESAIRAGSKDWDWVVGELIKVPLTAAERLPVADLGQVEAPLQTVAAALDGARVLGLAADRAKVLRRVTTLLTAIDPTGPVTIPADLLPENDAFGPPARAALLARYDERTAALALTHLSGYAGSVTPTAAWRKATAAACAGDPALAQVAGTLLETVLSHQEARVEHRWRDHVYYEPEFTGAASTVLLRAAVWVAAAASTPGVTRLLGDVAVHCGMGPGGNAASRCASVTSSAIAALSERAAANQAEAVAVVAQLARVRAKVANKTINKGLDKALQSAADAAGLTTGQLLERAVPDFGLDGDGRGEVPVGDHTALLALSAGSGGAKVALSWRTPAGRVVSGVPAAVKDAHAPELAELRAVAQDLKKPAAIQRARVEDQFGDDRTWSGADWAACYVDHPVVGLTARSLLWQVRPADAEDDRWATGLPERAGIGWALRDHSGVTIPVGPEDQARLWHPIREPLAEIQAWRAHLTDAGLRQPFKQAFREIYLLTPAEETTGTYSNRFAAHILRYPQAGALMRTRGWAATHLGYWDGGWDGTATKVVGDGTWRASFYYDLVDRPEDGYEHVSLCSTDQVRFEARTGPGARGGWQPRPLTEVPPLVFSEAMRDVDLFVGVTSVAGDPAWADRGTERFAPYWHQTSFGELTESAQMRREALERLLPRTKIADRVELTDRFLVVHGHLRDYKIHLGSGNILMSPADTYLCIVPARGARGPNVFLPFEEDGGKLAVILSKAFLLAEDTAITDPSITVQLRLGL